MLSFDERAVLEQAKQGYGTLTPAGKVNVWFYMHATKDDLASRREGYPVYKDSPYLSRRGQGEKDYMSGPASPVDIQQNPEAWALFQNWLKNPKASVKSLPRLTPAGLRLLEDCKIYSIEDLAETQTVTIGETNDAKFYTVDQIPELERLQRVAQAWLGNTEPAPKKLGRPKGSKNGKDAQAAA